MQAAHAKPIFIDGNKYEVTEATLTGAQIRALGQVPAGYRLFQDLPGHEDRLIEDSTVVEIKPGEKFYSLPLGQVGTLLVAKLEQELESLREEFAGAWRDEENGVQHIHVPNVALPTTVWNRAQVELLIQVPPLYPQQPIPGFETDAALRLVSGAQPAGTGFQPFHGRQYMHFCWNPAGLQSGWRSLVEYVRFCARRFRDQPL